MSATIVELTVRVEVFGDPAAILERAAAANRRAFGEASPFGETLPEAIADLVVRANPTRPGLPDGFRVAEVTAR